MVKAFGMHARINGGLKANAAQLFYELYLLNDNGNQFTKHEKSLMGLGYLFLENHQMEFLSEMSLELNSVLASDVLKTMQKVVEEGLIRLMERRESISYDRLEEYCDLSYALRILQHG